MAIVKMRKLRLVAARSQKEGVLRELMLLGCVEITEPQVDPPSIGFEAPKLVGDSSPGKIKTKLDTLKNALNILNKYDGYKVSFLAALPDLQWEKLDDDALAQESLEAAQEIIHIDEKVRARITEANQIRNTITSLMPWQSLDVPLEMTETRSCQVMTGTVPKSKNLDMKALEQAVSLEFKAAQLFTISEDDDCYYMLVICMKSEQDGVLEILRGHSFALVSFGGMRGGAKENVETCEKRLKRLAREREKLTEEIIAFGPSREGIWSGIDYLTTCMDRAVAEESTLQTEHSVLLEGWLMEPDEKALRKRLGSYDCAWEMKDPEPDEYPEVPVTLKNGKISTSLNFVTNMYALPAYDGIDPNPLMAPFFIFFYGMMMADMGYGLLMMIAAFVLLKKKKPRGSMSDFSVLLGACGISAFIFGFLTGGFFGDFLTQLTAFFNPENPLVLWSLFTPLEDTMMILLGSLALGIIQMITGMMISVVKKCKDGEVLSAIFDEVTWWIILAGVVCVIFVTPYVLYVGIAMLVVGQFILKKNVVKAFVGLFAAVYNGVTGIFSDVLSYSRLMALMLSGSIIATVFNTLGTVPGNVIIFVVIALLGNALNFVLSILSCYVHDLRLQCLEFFGRFYKDGGRAFKPLTINTKFYNVLKEERNNG